MAVVSVPVWRPISSDPEDREGDIHRFWMLTLNRRMALAPFHGPPARILELGLCDVNYPRALSRVVVGVGEVFRLDGGKILDADEAVRQLDVASASLEEISGKLFSLFRVLPGRPDTDDWGHGSAIKNSMHLVIGRHEIGPWTPEEERKWKHIAQQAYVALVENGVFELQFAGPPVACGTPTNQGRPPLRKLFKNAGFTNLFARRSGWPCQNGMLMPA
jgi:hypothetical protein